jgi:hypothetical protein
VQHWDILTSSIKEAVMGNNVGIVPVAFYAHWHGGFSWRIDMPMVQPLDCVFATITETRGERGEPFLAAASMRVDNVVPHRGFVEVRGSVGWDSDIWVRVMLWTPQAP